MIQTMMKKLLGSIQAEVSADQVKSAVHAYLDSWRNGDAEARIGLFADNAVVEDPVGAPALEGKTALQEFWRSAATAPTVFEPNLERIVVNGNEAMIAFSMRITVTGLPSCTLQILENVKLDQHGKIVRLRAFWDEHCVA